MQPTQGLNFTPSEELLAVSLELSNRSWKIALRDGKRDKPAVHTVASEHPDKRLSEATAVIESTKKKWELPERLNKIFHINQKTSEGARQFMQYPG